MPLSGPSTAAPRSCASSTFPTRSRRAGELLVRVHATTVNRTDCAYRSGKPLGSTPPSAAGRDLGSRSSGSEYAGEVEAVGERRHVVRRR